MLATDRDAVICDLAETYHILDYNALPVPTLAVLASGLRENSRIKMKMAGLQYIPLELVAPQIADSLTMIRYDLAGEKKHPKLLFDIVHGNIERKEYRGFASGADFEAERKRILGEHNG